MNVHAGWTWVVGGSGTNGHYRRSQTDLPAACASVTSALSGPSSVSHCLVPALPPQFSSRLGHPAHPRRGDGRPSQLSGASFLAPRQKRRLFVAFLSPAPMAQRRIPTGLAFGPALGTKAEGARNPCTLLPVLGAAGRAVSSRRTQAAWADFPLRRLAGELLATVLPSPRPVALLRGPACLSSGNGAFFPLAALRTFCLCWGFCSVTITELPVGFFSFLLPETLCCSSVCSLDSWLLKYGLCPFSHFSSETQVLSAHLSFRCLPLSPVFST